MLEASYRIQSRAGLHCAPRMHDALGTAIGGGTLRLSPGFATTTAEIDIVITALQQVVAVTMK
jgi:selenocysteine lyase/cysteine desulfurase